MINFSLVAPVRMVFTCYVRSHMNIISTLDSNWIYVYSAKGANQFSVQMHSLSNIKNMDETTNNEVGNNAI